MNKILWQKYLDRKIQRYADTPEKKAISEALEDVFPGRWEIQQDISNVDEMGFYEVDFKDYLRAHVNPKVAWHEYQKVAPKISSLFIFNLEITIFFPEIVIKNRTGKSHLIRELWVKIPLNLLNLTDWIRPLGMRSLFTLNEYNRGYSHSHLLQHSFKNWRYFCVGSSELGCYQHKEVYNTDVMKIKSFLYCLQSYLEYESIEGTPYIKFEGNEGMSTLSYNKVISSTLYKIISEETPPLKFNKALKIINREEIEKWLAPKIPIKVAKFEGKYYNIVRDYQIAYIKSQIDTYLLNFKNTKINLKIDNYVQQEKPEEYPAPCYTESLIRYYESKAIEACIRDKRTGGKSKSSNTRESAKPSEVFE